MLTRKVVWLAGALALLTCVMVSASNAQPFDRRTFFTFSGPVEIPGTVLPAGKYMFHVMDPFSGLNVVQITSADGQTALAMFITVAAERMDPPDEPEIRFMEAPAGTPPGIKTWWYPGSITGWEFIYPKEQARRLASAALRPVLTTKAETRTPEETKAAELERISPAGETELETATPRTVPEGPVQYGEVMIPPATPEGVMAQAQPHRALPRTGSLLPIAEWAGIWALGAAFLLRTYRRAAR